MAVACPETLHHVTQEPPHSKEALQWFALQVRARWERMTETLLRSKGYETFLPTQTIRHWGTRQIKEVETPLFPGYVFCSFSALKRLPILVTPGVIAVVGRGRIPTPVDSAELDAIRAIVRSGRTAQPWPYLEVGQRVRIEDEALQGLEGILVSLKGCHRVVLSVSLLRRSVALEIDRCRVHPIRP
jgi:transcription termination/antitermination protein NusG